MNTPASPLDFAQPLAPEDFDTLDTILDALREQDDEVPQWEFCEGALAALLCTRRLIPPHEYLPVLLGLGDGPGAEETADGDEPNSGARFADDAQAAQFMGLWLRRWNEVSAALFEVGGTRSAANASNLHHFWRNARTHTLHDPVRWKYQHIGRGLLHGEAPPRHGVF